MKNLQKNLFLLFAFSLIFSGLYACKNTTAEKADDKVPGESRSETKENTDEEAEGMVLPEVVMTTESKMLDGETFKAADNKGKVTLINLWATWCGPCRQEMPELVAMENEYKDKGFQIIGLDIDEETPEQIKAFAKEMKLNYRLGWSPHDLTVELFKLGRMGEVIPQSFLINRDGKLVGIFQGGSKPVVEKMRETIDRVVKN